MIRKHSHRFGICLLVATTIAAMLASSGAAADRPDMRALHLRSDALNRLYGVRSPVSAVPDTSKLAYRVRSEWLNTHYGTAAMSMSPAAFVALRARSNALNERYQLGSYAQVPAPAGGGLEWTTLTAVAVVGAGAVLASAIALGRGRHWHLPTAHSH